ncbi:hypothetical protein GCM10027277_10310 [Pseudoduganella ginsengisoli]|uniref:Uncharacterized protein n=1 Tax=Pseudoduganella ginsengisoli TaxID=1462440 RepID=A0A6L6PVA6_9BURK|nr:hypothetical protein [Pseudoduganella ginsengisoli]MTW01427.1 hypothetical protein [Pseudoduganella ginsengisoli]
MHAELPKKGALASFKAFTAEYTMIVISILTALGLEHAATSWHHKHQAHQAAARIEAEVAGTLKELREAIDGNEPELKKYAALKEYVHGILEESESKTGQAKTDYEQATKVQLQQRLDADMTIKLSFPTFRHEAWDVAVASQAASWMEADELHRYSGIYAHQRESNAMIAQSITMVNGPTIIGALPRLQLKGKSFDERNREVYQLIVDYSSQLRMVQSNLKSLEATIKEANAAKA